MMMGRKACTCNDLMAQQKVKSILKKKKKLFNKKAHKF